MASNFNFNKVILGGRLTADPEMKSTPSGVPVTSFTVAVNRRHQKGEETQADFINVTAWRETAKFVCQFFRKASPICVVGSIQTRSWTDQQGQKRYATEVVADEAYFVDAKGEASTSAPHSAPAYAPASQYVPEQYQQPQMRELDPEEDLPF